MSHKLSVLIVANVFLLVIIIDWNSEIFCTLVGTETILITGEISECMPISDNLAAKFFESDSVLVIITFITIYLTRSEPALTKSR